MRDSELAEESGTEKMKTLMICFSICAHSVILHRAAPDTNETLKTFKEGTVYLYVHVCVYFCALTCSYSIMMKPAQIPACQL